MSASLNVRPSAIQTRGVHVIVNVAPIEDDADVPVVGELRSENSAFRIVCAFGQSAVRRRSTVAH